MGRFHYQEIIQKNSGNKEFVVAIEAPFGKDKEQKSILIQFYENEAIPKVKAIKIRIDNSDVLANFKPKEIHYRENQVDKYCFDEWVKDFDFPKKYQKIPIPSFDIPFSLAINAIEHEVKRQDKEIPRKFGLQIRPFFPRYTWLAPIRAKAKRTYESFKIKFSPEGEHVPSLLRKLLSSNTKSKNKELIETLEKFGEQSNLFDKIEIKELGKSKSSPFEINVKYGKTPIKLPNVGYGVSQVLPLIVEILSTKNHFFSIQQPEVHLHPKAQAAFGEFIFNSFKTNQNSFVIETHSDFTINRFRFCLGKSKKEKPSSQVVFFERDEEGTKLTPIEILDSGEFQSNLPDTYREFFIDEELKLLEL